jgi:hypothetical protein
MFNFIKLLLALFLPVGIYLWVKATFSIGVWIVVIAGILIILGFLILRNITWSATFKVLLLLLFFLVQLFVIIDVFQFCYRFACGA